MLCVTEITWHTTWWEACLRLVIAAFCGGIIGWDRESEGRAAGLRTYMMVALGAAGFTLVAMELMSAIDNQDSPPGADPAKIIAAIVGGIGFLGAGAIIQSGGKVKGLTTAAGLWVIAAVGMAAGAGYYIAAGAVTVLAFVILVVLRRFEEIKFDKSEDKD